MQAGTEKLINKQGGQQVKGERHRLGGVLRPPITLEGLPH